MKKVIFALAISAIAVACSSNEEVSTEQTCCDTISVVVDSVAVDTTVVAQ